MGIIHFLIIGPVQENKCFQTVISKLPAPRVWAYAQHGLGRRFLTLVNAIQPVNDSLSIM